MRKRLSALISGFIVAPALAATPVVQPPVPSIEAPAEAFPSAMPAAVDDKARRLARGERLDAHGMQALTTQINRRVEALLNAAVQRPAGPRLHPVQIQFAPPAPVPATAVRPARTEKAAFLGVSSSPVSATLRAQLNLPRGMGLVVDFVEKDSPADKAGLQVHDVLQKLDDQWLISAQQLAILVRAKKPGDEIKLLVIRAGKPTELSARLIEKEVAVLEDMQDPQLAAPGGAPIITLTPDQLLQHLGNGGGSSMSIDGNGAVTRRRVDDHYDITLTRDPLGHESVVVIDRQNNNRTLYQGPPDKAELAPELMKKIQDLQQMPNRIELHTGDPAGGPVSGSSSGWSSSSNGAGTTRSFSATRVDDNHQVTLTSDGTTRHVVVKEMSNGMPGKTIYEGSPATEEDFKSMPAGVADKVKAMIEKMK